MKNINFTLSLAVISISFSLTSCSSSDKAENGTNNDATEAAITKLEAVGNETIEALKAGDTAKADSLSSILEAMVDSIGTMNPTPEQQKLLEEINAKVTEQYNSAAQDEQPEDTEASQEG